jgi:GR25 family glycosyltransferase involved in LPS biosynthesis
MIPIFVVHHAPLVERKTYLQKLLPYAEFVEKPMFSVPYVNDPELWKSRTEGLYGGEVPFREMRIGDLDCTNKHHHALTEASNLTTPSLILEDDAILMDGFYECLRDITRKKYEHLWDIAFVGGAFHHTVAPTISYEENNPFVTKGHPCGNTVCAYVIKPNVAALIGHDLYSNSTVLPIDFEFNFICKERKLRVCHYLPYVVAEGSSAGFYQGSQKR